MPSVLNADLRLRMLLTHNPAVYHSTIKSITLKVTEHLHQHMLVFPIFTSAICPY